MKRASTVAVLTLAFSAVSAFGADFDILESLTQPSDGVVKVYDIKFGADGGENITAFEFSFSGDLFQTWAPGPAETLWGVDGSTYPADSGISYAATDVLIVSGSEANDECFGNNQGYGDISAIFGLQPQLQGPDSVVVARVAVRPGDTVVMDATVSFESGAEEQFHGVALPVTAEGDMNHDGLLDATDIDLISAAVVGGNDLYDVTGDCSVGSADRDYWVQTLMGTTYGDADLNGSVDGLDISLLVNNFGAGSTTTSSSLIPEPATMVMLGLGGLAVLRRRRK